jgi:hypothetical protein
MGFSFKQIVGALRFQLTSPLYYCVCVVSDIIVIKAVSSVWNIMNYSRDLTSSRCENKGKKKPNVLCRRQL